MGIHQLLGFVENFNSKFSCRFCKIEKPHRKYCCKADLTLLRNRVNYETDLKLNDYLLTGLTEKCVFNDIPSCHATDNLFGDLMHDGPEGFVEFDMYEIINHYITKTDFFTLEELNNIMVSFDYGPYCGNIPPLISENNMKNGKIKMSASEMLTFVRNFGLMVGHCVPHDDSVWKFYLIVRQLLDLLLSTGFQKDCINLLRTLIEEHNRTFINLFKKPLKPKAHNLVHYPEIITASGPPVHFWTMRQESKHRESKITASASKL